MVATSESCCTGFAPLQSTVRLHQQLVPHHYWLADMTHWPGSSTQCRAFGALVGLQTHTDRSLPKNRRLPRRQGHSSIIQQALIPLQNHLCHASSRCSPTVDLNMPPMHLQAWPTKCPLTQASGSSNEDQVLRVWGTDLAVPYIQGALQRPLVLSSEQVGGKWQACVNK